MDISVYSSDNCYPCELLKLFLEINNITYNIYKMRELDFASCAPCTVVTKSNTKNHFSGFKKDEYIKWLESYDIFINIDLKYIFNETLKTIFNEDIKKFKMLLILFPEVKTFCDGWSILHYLFDEYWINGIHEYINQKGDINIKTQDKILSIGSIPLFIVGGRSALHILIESKNYDKYDKWTNKINIEKDNNGHLPLDLKNTNQISTSSYNKVRQRLLINFNFESNISFNNLTSFIDGVYNFTIDQEYINNFNNKLVDIKINSNKNISPNSMHKYGIFLNDTILYNDILQIAKTALINYYGNTDNIVSIYSFYIEYSDITNINLDKHKDDSLLTINICLENNSDGADLVFDDFDKKYIHKTNVGLMHSGKMEHHVTKLIKGTRKNIIIWIK